MRKYFFLLSILAGCSISNRSDTSTIELYDDQHLYLSDRSDSEVPLACDVIVKIDHLNGSSKTTSFPAHFEIRSNRSFTFIGFNSFGTRMLLIQNSQGRLSIEKTFLWRDIAPEILFFAFQLWNDSSQSIRWFDDRAELAQISKKRDRTIVSLLRSEVDISFIGSKCGNNQEPLT